MLSGPIFVTGGTGFLARGIYRRAAHENWPCTFTAYSRDEEKQFRLRSRWPHIRCILGDVRNAERLELAMAGHETVIHTAAVKYIPEAEFNAAECLAINTGGAQAVISAARKAGVRKVIGISTDKACQPVNVYGCSKMAMERLFAEASTPEITFTCVRYGNVIGSTGSVIPLFRQQARELGKVTLTDPKMTRFWMSVDEAIDLILLALNNPPSPGAIFIPLVRSMKMGDVVLAAVGEVPVDIIGLRPGEKMHERLLHYEESVRVELFSDHFRLYPPGHSTGVEPFTLSSQNPHHWMEISSMREFIADAQEV